MAIAMLIISTEILASNTAVIVKKRRITSNTIGKRACKNTKARHSSGYTAGGVASVRGVSEKAPSG
jgi:hypothetical protein